MLKIKKHPVGIYGIADNIACGWNELPELYDQRNYLANHTVLPGEIAVDSAWQRRGEELLGQVDLSDCLTAYLAAVVSAKTPKGRVEALNRLDGEIRGALTGVVDGQVALAKDQWFHEENEPKPSEYQHGPLMGSQKDLACWTLPGKSDRRVLINRCRAGTFWAKKRGRCDFELWFKSADAFHMAWQEKVDQTRANS